MTKKNGDKPHRFEWEGEYTLDVDKEKRRLIFDMLGKFRKPGDIPKFVEHTRQALDLIPPGDITMIAYIYTAKPPALAVTKYLRESLKLMKERGLNKAAVVTLTVPLLQKMTVKVLNKIVKIDMKAFTAREEAEAWLDKEE